MVGSSATTRSSAPAGIVAALRAGLAATAPLTVFSIGMVLLTLLFAVGIAADTRTVAGQAAWLKPTKFGISIAVYSLSLVWMLRFIRSTRPWMGRLVGGATWVVVVTFVAEIVAIVLQVVRGTTSHFNVATPFDAAVWAVMALSVSALWVANLVLVVVLMVQRFDRPSFAWSLRLGLLVAVIGMGQGFLMTSPTAQQLAGWEAGGAVTVVGAHSVGAPDGGRGLPVTGWRTDVGDLRVGHFVGIHALQAIPLVGWFVSRRRRLGERQRTALVVTAASAYLGLTVLLTVQALRAQPLVRPDAFTLWGFAALAAAVVLAVVVIVRPYATATSRSRTS